MNELSFVTDRIGKPSKLEADPRKGIAAFWGSREPGALGRERGKFAVARGPIDTVYEVNLIPSPQSRHRAENLTLSADELNAWVKANCQLILEVLGGY